MSRSSRIERITTETSIVVGLEIDGSGQASVDTGIGFFDHLLASFAHHALFDLDLIAKGDLEIDDHHTVEDAALALGQAMSAALADRAGLNRFGDATVPMDEALATAAVDTSGRPFAIVDLSLRSERIGNLTCQNISHALEAFTRTSGITLHLTATGTNDHHIAEASFKALARALMMATAINPQRQGVPSTKGTL
jgi:imidazoleglycerol-phosphate dehydratase